MGKRAASLSLDLDNKWSYMKNNGSDNWNEFQSYLDIFVPYVLELLKELDLKLTFFVVGQDAEFEKNHKYLKMIADEGHEIGNHSFKHETFLHLYTKEELQVEIEKAHTAIKKVTGRDCKGFRGPGFTWSQELFEVLEEKGYCYDSSTFPTIIGPLARMYYFKTSKLTDEQKKERKELFGKLSDGFMKLRPYFWTLKNNRRLYEVPVTTMPLFRLPIHMTYLVYLSAISEQLAFFYLKCAIYLCKLTRTSPHFLIHPTDLLGGDMVSGMEFFPGMQIAGHKKAAFFKKVIGIFSRHFTLVSMDGFVNGILKTNKKEVNINSKPIL
ncbi:polysaccharide deacetylase family protein [Maribacter algicola]|uniref:Polysaccharide deacetylase family protein n=1 Tax=Meishania litoralis TaxID=3434685 RepID=A0ACC7LK83_9FLAO